MERGVHNVASGFARNVVQAGSIGSVVFKYDSGDVQVPQQLPMAATNFVNQEEVLARLDEAVQSDHSPRVYCVVGAPGVGKTAVVVHWAHLQTAKYADGVLFADLRGFDPAGPPAEPGEVLDGFLAALGLADALEGSSLEGRAAAYRTAMAGRRMLVVLDNAASAAQVRPLLPGGVSMVLLTSRATLRALTIREGAVVLDVEPLPTAEAADLLRRVIGAEGGGDDPAVEELARRCGFLPLALRIAGERIASGYYARVTDLVEELANEADVLDLLDTDDEATALRPVFSVSYRHLALDQRRLFRLLGLAPGVTIGSEAAAALTESSRSRARKALDGLRQANLIEQMAADRYRLHDLLRIFAVERVENEEEAEERLPALRRVLTWYLASAVNADAVLDARHPGAPSAEGEGRRFADTTSAMEWLRAEQSNLVACVRRAASAGEHGTAWRLAAVLFEFFYRQKAWDDWTATHTIGVKSARSTGDRHGVASLLGRLAIAYRERAEHDRAAECFREALEIWTELGDDDGQAWIAGRYAQACREQGRHEEAMELCVHALAACQRSGARQEEGIVHNNLSGIHRDAGRLDEALAHSEEAIAAFEETGYQRGLSWARNNAANVHRDAGRFAIAIELYERVLVARRELSDEYGYALTLRELGHTLCASGDIANGTLRLRECVDRFPPGDPNAEDARRLLARYRHGTDTIG
jgi:tetratricopeptide (TPR) repeat protein